uniref:Uncharacterized protein n=1 Tax=Rhizophora mucronata TaxID=61149 RepID=A0A2P2R5E5_RHIMU
MVQTPKNTMQSGCHKIGHGDRSEPRHGFFLIFKEKGYFQLTNIG